MRKVTHRGFGAVWGLNVPAMSGHGYMVLCVPHVCCRFSAGWERSPKFHCPRRFQVYVEGSERRLWLRVKSVCWRFTGTVRTAAAIRTLGKLIHFHKHAHLYVY